MSTKKMILRMDRIGMTASTLCAIHCAAMPLLLTSLPLLGLGFLTSKWLEWGMIAIAFVVGTSSILSSYFNIHRRVSPLLLLIAGFTLIISGHTIEPGWTEAAIVGIGGMGIAMAHFLNQKYNSNCEKKLKRW